jgi:hypothetical protein
MAVRERQLAFGVASAVLEAPSEQCDLDLLVLVQASERPETVGGRVPGDEQHGLHVNACS